MIFFSKFKTVSCEELYYFHCSTPMNPDFLCPEDYFYYKGKCLFKSKETQSLSEAKHTCALRGGIVLPIKSKGMYLFLQKYLLKEQSDNLYLGLNLTNGVNIFTDNSLYSPQSYDYEGDSVKLVGHSCAYLKKGIGYQPRGTPCHAKLEFLCLWTGK